MTGSIAYREPKVVLRVQKGDRTKVKEAVGESFLLQYERRGSSN